jgi:chaperonin GroES
MNITPLFDKVVIEEIVPETVTKSGIVLPSSAQEKPNLAKVVAVGSGDFVNGKVVPMQVKVGDVVLYSQYAGNTFTYENKTYKILKQNDIMAIVKQ